MHRKCQNLVFIDMLKDYLIRFKNLGYIGNAQRYMEMSIGQKNFGFIGNGRGHIDLSMGYKHIRNMEDSQSKTDM